MGWIGVDLDGTLAEYHTWGDGSIGKPIAPMVSRVKQWISEGREVRIVTARVSPCGRYSEESQAAATEEFCEQQRRLVESWCEEHIGECLLVTDRKDYQMEELWDDRCVPVIPNEGLPAITIMQNATLVPHLKTLRQLLLIAEAYERLMVAYRLGDQKRADRALTLLGSLGCEPQEVLADAERLLGRD